MGVENREHDKKPREVNGGPQDEDDAVLNLPCVLDIEDEEWECGYPSEHDEVPGVLWRVVEDGGGKDGNITFPSAQYERASRGIPHHGKYDASLGIGQMVAV